MTGLAAGQATRIHGRFAPRWLGLQSAPMLHRLLRLAPALVAVLIVPLIASCGGERNATTAAAAPALSAPASALATSNRCDGLDGAEDEPAPAGFRRVEQRCWRSTAVLDAPAPTDSRRRALAAPTRTITVTELFDWAEVEYAVYFPSRRDNLQLGPYTYRFYPESQNHLAVADGLVYVQGPVSGGALLLVGPLADFTCRALPALCVDTPLDCNTAGLAWTMGGNQCTPNATDPAQVAHGSTFTFTDSVQTSGQAAFRCDNGRLLAAGDPTCAPAAGAACKPATVEWAGSGGACSADAVPEEIADGKAYSFVDTSPDRMGRADFRCVAGTLQAIGTPTCAPPEVQDSFGGDGGAADGGASGDGTAGDGAPLVGAAVRVVDTTGKVATATTDSRGYFRVRLTGMVPPLLVRVAHPDGRVRHSISFQPLRTNGYVFIAVTPLTDKIVSDVAALGELVGPGALTPTQALRLGVGAVTTMVTALRNNALVRAELVAAGINPDTFNPLSAPFRADGTGYDRVLDNLVLAYESGRTVLRSRVCTITEVSWTVGNATCSAGGTGVTIKLLPGSTATLQDATGPTRGGATFTCELGLPKVLNGATCSGS